MIGMLCPIPSFIALIIITPQIRWKKKLEFIGIGLVIIFVFRIFLELMYVFYECNQSILMDFMVGFLSGPIRIALPLAIWGIFVYYSQNKKIS